MAAQPTVQPVYLERRSYRRRRLRDAARIMPVAGAVLWMLPLLSSNPKTGAVGLYIMGVWIVLILISAAIAARLHDAPEGDETAKDPAPDR